MIFSCSSCRTKYKIPDEKVAHKVLKVRCKTCGAVLVVRDPRLPTGRQAAVMPTGAPKRASQVGIKVATAPPTPPPPPRPTPKPAPVAWFVSIRGAQVGPLDTAALRQRIQQGDVGPASYVWRAGLPAWTQAAEVPELAALLTPPPAAPPPPPPGAPASDGQEDLGGQTLQVRAPAALLAERTRRKAEEEARRKDEKEARSKDEKEARRETLSLEEASTQAMRMEDIIPSHVSAPVPPAVPTTARADAAGREPPEPEQARLEQVAAEKAAEAEALMARAQEAAAALGSRPVPVSSPPTSPSAGSNAPSPTAGAPSPPLPAAETATPEEGTPAAPPLAPVGFGGGAEGVPSAAKRGGPLLPELPAVPPRERPPTGLRSRTGAPRGGEGLTPGGVPARSSGAGETPSPAAAPTALDAPVVPSTDAGDEPEVDAQPALGAADTEHGLEELDEFFREEPALDDHDQDDLFGAVDAAPSREDKAFFKAQMREAQQALDGLDLLGDEPGPMDRQALREEFSLLIRLDNQRRKHTIVFIAAGIALVGLVVLGIILASQESEERHRMNADLRKGDGPSIVSAQYNSMYEALKQQPGEGEEPAEGAASQPQAAPPAEGAGGGPGGARKKKPRKRASRKKSPRASAAPGRDGGATLVRTKASSGTGGDSPARYRKLSKEEFAALTDDGSGKGGEVKVAGKSTFEEAAQRAEAEAERKRAAMANDRAQAVAAVFRKKVRQFARCKVGPEEKVRLTFEVNAAGRVVSAKATGTKNVRKLTCVKEILQRAQFPPGDDSARYSFNMTL